MKGRKSFIFIAEAAIFTALALVLDWVCNLLFTYLWPNGGSISIAMVPIFIMGYKWGPKGGFLVGFLVGTIQLLWSSYLLNPLQVCLDYVFAYGVCGVASLFYPLINTTNKLLKHIYICVGIFIGGILRLLCAVLAGVFFWETKFWPSLVYNGTYMIPSIFVCMIITCILVESLKTFMQKN